MRSDEMIELNRVYHYVLVPYFKSSRCVSLKLGDIECDGKCYEFNRQKELERRRENWQEEI